MPLLFSDRIRQARMLAPLCLSAVLLLSGCSTFSEAWNGIWSDSSADKPVQQQSVATQQVSAAGDISVRWRHDVDQRKPASAPGFSLPAVIATGHGKVVVAGAQDRRVRVYSADGSELDRIALHNASESGAVKLSNGIVVVGDTGGVLYGLDLSHGTIVWQVQLSAALIGSPVLVGDDFIVQTTNNQMYRFNNKGVKLWSFSGQLGGLGMHLSPTPVVYQGHVYAVFSNGDVLALQADSGNFVWKRQLVLSNHAAVMSEVKMPVATPLVVPARNSGRDEDMLVVSVFQGELFFLSLQDGSTLNTRKLSVKSRPLLIGGSIFVADTAGSLSALDASNAATLWKKKLSDGELNGPVLWQGNLWLTDDQARVFRLNQDGSVLASSQLDGRIDRMPVVADNGILVRNNRGTLYLLH